MANPYRADDLSIEYFDLGITAPLDLSVLGSTTLALKTSRADSEIELPKAFGLRESVTKIDEFDWPLASNDLSTLDFALLRAHE